VDVTSAFLANADALIAKALVVSEVAQIARSEMRMRVHLLNHWRIRADQAALKAGNAVASGRSLEAALSVSDTVMDKFAGDVERGFKKEIETGYRLARNAGWKKGTGQTKASLSYQVANFTQQIEEGKEKVVKASRKSPKATVAPVFDLADERAIKDLQDDQMIWVSRFYRKELRAAIRQSVKPSLIQGMGRTAAGKELRRALTHEFRNFGIPKGYKGSDASYFEGLAANTMTNARVRGQIRSFNDLGLETYVIVNPDDERTTEICRHMNGKTFQTADAVAHIEKLSGAKNPNFVRQNHPWLTHTKLLELSPKPGQQSAKDSKALVAAGLPLPPYHFRCRTTVDAI
jgi:SPP1 gp7 family putative phage head morphogenesis protein